MGIGLSMYVEREAPVGEPTSQERRQSEQNDKRILGNVVQCDALAPPSAPMRTMPTAR